MIAKYKCLKCNYRWEKKPGPVICPKCSYVYVKWINFKEVMDQIEINKYFNFGEK